MCSQRMCVMSSQLLCVYQFKTAHEFAGWQLVSRQPKSSQPLCVMSSQRMCVMSSELGLLCVYQFKTAHEFAGWQLVS